MQRSKACILGIGSMSQVSISYILDTTPTHLQLENIHNMSI